MGTPRSGPWIAATLVASAVSACLWLFLAHAGDDADLAPSPPVESAVSAAAQRPTAPLKTNAGEELPVVEIDDAPLPDDATFVVRGSVSDASGAPIEGARVELVTQLRGPESYGETSRAAKAGTDGSYVREGLDASAVWSAQASAVGFAESPWANAVLATSKRREIRRDFILARLGGLDVVVLDERGAPIEHRVWVVTTTPDGNSGETGQRGPPPGRYRVFVSASDRAAETRDVDVADGATSRVEFRLGPAVAISGVLLAADGEPMSGYDVVAVAADETPPRSDHRATTGRDGSFTLRGLRRARYEVRPDAVGAERLEFTADGGERVDAPADAVRLTARAAGTVRFHLVYPPGFTTSQRSAEVGVAVIVRSRDHRVAARWDYDRGAVNVPGGEDVELVLDVPECLQFRRRVNVRAGDSTDLGDVALVAEREIVGRVVDADGRGVWGAGVVGRLDDGARVGGMVEGVDRNGWFRLERLPPGELAVEVGAGGFASTTVRCESGRSEPLIVTLRRGGRLFVRARSAAGAPLAGVAVRFVATDGVAPTGAVLDAFGEFAERVAASRWRVEVAGCVPVDADVREGATTSVTVRAVSR